MFQLESNLSVVSVNHVSDGRMLFLKSGSSSLKYLLENPQEKTSGSRISLNLGMNIRGVHFQLFCIADFKHILADGKKFIWSVCIK